MTGVEMSPQMLALARDGEAAFQEESALYNTEFREGRIEDLPLFDNSVEVVLSNCVLKLAANRTQACREAFRVLKPGGRLVLCDLVLAPDSRCDVPGQRNDAAQGIVDAISCDEFLAGIRAAGFDGLEILSLQRYVSEQDCGSSVNNGRESLPTQQVACLALLAIKAV